MYAEVRESCARLVVQSNYHYIRQACKLIRNLPGASNAISDQINVVAAISRGFRPIATTSGSDGGMQVIISAGAGTTQ
ncbi:hypothetical protein NEUTE2DRAFT_131072 [Neurospora tetrasperma FGSC 2509]|nr:hypothetical protein NEUTE2DRAFT_131072 [Neurospora tetrasperma FGSC 2509]